MKDFFKINFSYRCPYPLTPLLSPIEAEKWPGNFCDRIKYAEIIIGSSVFSAKSSRRGI